MIALGVVAVLLVATIAVMRKPAGDDVERPSDPWSRIDRAQVTKIVIQRPGDAPAIELEKRDNRWVMTAPAQGPADETAVNDALEGLSEMHVESVAARERASHDELEVDPAHAIRVQLFRGTTRALDVWVGKNLQDGSAVRAEGNPVVFRVNRSVRYTLSKEPREWRDRKITHLERDHVRHVEWRNDGQTWRFDRNGETWTPAASNPPIARLDTARVNQAVVNLLDLTATDFAASGAQTGISDSSPSVTINVDNGDPVTLRLGSNSGEGDVYVQRQGNDIVYTIGRSRGEDIAFDPARFQTPVASDAGTGDAAAADSGAGGAGGGNNLPPEVMQQIRQQLQQRGVQMQGH